MSDARCTNPSLFIQKEPYEKKMFIRCMNLITSSLIAGFPSNHPVPAELLYSCTYWGSHLAESTKADLELADIIDKFAKEFFLRWLEVMVSAERVSAAVTCIFDAKTWVVSEPRRWIARGMTEETNFSRAPAALVT